MNVHTYTHTHTHNESQRLILQGKSRWPSTLPGLLNTSQYCSLCSPPLDAYPELYLIIHIYLCFQPCSIESLLSFPDDSELRTEAELRLTEHHACPSNSRAGKMEKGQKGFRGSLASQISLCGELQARERPYLKIKKWTAPEKQCISVSLLAPYMHVHHTVQHTQTNTGMFF